MKTPSNKYLIAVEKEQTFSNTSLISFDAAMASGYTLLADSKILLKKGAEKSIKIIDITDLF